MNMSARTSVAAMALVAVAATAAGTPLALPVAAPARAQTQTVLPPSEPRGTIGIALADAPSGAHDDPRAYRYIVGHLDAGESVTRRVEISNDTDVEKVLEIYAGPASVHGGRFLPSDPGAGSALTRMVSVDPPVVRLAPGGSTAVSVTISAPRDAPMQEHYGVIWASHSTPAGSAGGRQLAGVDTISRVGVRVYLSTGAERPAGPDFEVIGLRPIRDAAGVLALVATVANIGGRAVDIAGTVELTEGPGGLSAPPVAGESATLAPGETADVAFRLAPDASLPPGEWRATIDLASGTVRRESVQTISLEPVHAAPPSGSGPTERTLVSDRLLLPVAVLVALALAFAVWRAAINHRR